MKTQRLIEVVAVMAIVLSFSVLGTSLATAKVQVVQNVRHSRVADPSVRPTPPAFPTPTPGQPIWSWVGSIIHWVGLLWQWLLQTVPFRF